jgi:hypothetical protein
MEFKDHSSQIAEVSKSYVHHETPMWLVRWQELMQQLQQWWYDFWERFFNSHRGSAVSDSRGFSTLLQYGLYVAGFIALLVIFYLLWRRAVRLNEEKKGSTRGAALVEKILDSDGYRQEAERLSSACDYKGACRALYLCLLQRMHEKNVAVFAPAKTNYEYRYLLAAYPALQRAFMRLAEIVEIVWFGNKLAESSDYSQCVELLASAGQEVDQIYAEKAARLQESTV